MVHVDPRNAIPLGAAIVAAVATAAITIVVFTTGGFKYIDVPRQDAALTFKQRAIVKLAKDYGPGSGILYVWGGRSRSGFDCSGYVSYVVDLAGTNIPRTSFSQWHDRDAYIVPKWTVRPGDVVFFKSYGSYDNPGHVGLYIGHGKMIEYYRSGYPARLGYLSQKRDYVGARRWWHPVQVRKKIYGTAVWIAEHWGIRIASSKDWTVTFVPPEHRARFDSTKRARIVKWAHQHHHLTNGNRTYLNIKLR